MMIEQIESEAKTPVTHVIASGADQRAGVALGYFSLGLGLVELFAPRIIARLVGASPDGAGVLLIRALGTRELVSGIGLLRKPQSAAWLWSRVVGDAMDLALLGKQLASGESNRKGALIATAAVAGVTALDALSAARASG
jgi:hypothetical protein